MWSCTKSEAETFMEMQHIYEEQQSHVDSMIRQVAPLAEMIKEVKENRAKSEVDRSARIEKGVRRAEEEEPTNAEEESEALPEQEEAEEIETNEERVQADEKSMITPPDDGTPKEILEEARDESRLNEEAIECEEGIDSTPFYLQSDIVHASEGKVKEFTIMVKEESTSTEEPHPVIDQLEGCSYKKKEPEWKEEERTRRKAARDIYWEQLQPWPEPRRMAKPPHFGVRPKENKKIQGHIGITGKSGMSR